MNKFFNSENLEDLYNSLFILLGPDDTLILHHTKISRGVHDGSVYLEQTETTYTITGECSSVVGPAGPEHTEM